MKYLILVISFLYLSTVSNHAFANHIGYNCSIDDQMHCESGGDPSPDQPQNDPDPSPNSDPGDESPR